MPKRHQATSAPQRTAPPHGITPAILGRRDTVAVLIQAPFDAWYGQLASAAIGTAVAALRTHLDAHQADYAAADVTVLVEQRIPQDDALVCLLGCWRPCTRRAKAGVRMAAVICREHRTPRAGGNGISHG